LYFDRISKTIYTRDLLYNILEPNPKLYRDALPGYDINN